MKKIISSIIGLSAALCVMGAANNASASLPVSMFTWGSNNPATLEINTNGIGTYAQSLCTAGGFTGQTGYHGTDAGAWLWQNSTTGYWQIEGGSTPSGYATFYLQANCTVPGAFYGAGFDHIAYGTIQELSNANPLGVVEATPTSPTGTTANTFFPITGISGDFSTYGSIAETGGNELYLSNGGDEHDKMFTYGFQFQDVNNNPITPHTVQTYVINEGDSHGLPSPSVAYCFYETIEGPLSASNTGCYISYYTTQTAYSVPTGDSGGTAPSSSLTCIDFDLAN